MKKILFKRSEVAAKAPLAADLDVGEIALNLADRTIFSKNSAGEVISLSATSVADVEGLQEALDLKRDLSNNDFTNYTLVSADTVGVIDLDAAQMFRVDSSVARTLTFANVPGAGKATTILIHLHTITEGVTHTWPVGAQWSTGEPPFMEGSWMNIVALWTGAEWTLSVGSAEVTRFDLGEL